jgi:glyoxylase-like metal-dependent hydrolase (beta-lactamase superfamily II)
VPAAEEPRLLTRVGDVEVWIVPEIVIPTSVRWLLPDAPRDEVEAAKSWLRPHFMDEDGYLLQSIHSYLLKARGRNVLIDTGVGNAKRRGGGIPAFNMLETPFLERLEAAGVQPGEVDTVLCTHIHGDHVGWDAHLEGERWVPTFPNARHIFARLEFEQFSGIAKDQASSQQLWQDSVQPVVEAGLHDLVEPDYQVTPEIRFEPSHGHTPGHVSIKVDSAGQSAVFIGDAMHSPIQVRFPALRCALGGPEEASRRARMEILERYAGTGIPVFGAHFGAPCGGHVQRDGSGYRFEAISPQAT